LNKSRFGGAHLRRKDARIVNMNLLGQELNAPSRPIRSLIVFNANPAAVAPDSASVRRGLSRKDLLTVVLEHFQTDTADFADYVLPATTFLEHADLYTSYGHYYLQWTEPVVPPRGEARSNTWIFHQLAMRLGIDDETIGWSAEDVARSLLRSEHPFLDGITLERLKVERSIKLNLPQEFRPYCDGSHFPDRKVRFSPAPIQVEFKECVSREFPFRLISPPGDFLVNTTMGNLESIRKQAGGQPQVIIHPDDADELGVVDRSLVSITSQQGSIVRQALVSRDSPPRTVIALGQWWPKLAPDRKGLNELTSQRLTDLGGGSTFGNEVVSVSPIAIGRCD
jgi:anaerobic selenocysteine-containing dehydrogenase